MHAAGILRDIAADGAGDLRGRIRCVIKAVRFGRFGDSEVSHTGLDARDPLRRIDVQNPVEAHQTQDQSLGMWQRAAR